MRANYPTMNSTDSDTVTPSQDVLAGSGFLTPEMADQSAVDANWKWMQSFEQTYPGIDRVFLARLGSIGSRGTQSLQLRRSSDPYPMRAIEWISVGHAYQGSLSHAYSKYSGDLLANKGRG